MASRVSVLVHPQKAVVLCVILTCQNISVRSATRVTELLRRQYRIKNILLQLWSKKHSIIIQPYVAAESYTILILVGSNLGLHQFLLPPHSRCNPSLHVTLTIISRDIFLESGRCLNLNIFPCHW